MEIEQDRFNLKIDKELTQIGPRQGSIIRTLSKFFVTAGSTSPTVLSAGTRPIMR